MSFAPNALRRPLLRWYRRHRRDLPWRAPDHCHNPYRVWVSEVMLQQTQVAVVIPYYQRFLARFPTPAALARAPEADVLAAWSGLGYYRRVRHLHAAAKMVMTRHGGVVPLDYAALRALPGVGAYTAAAVLSIAAAQPLAAVDGNLARIASRLTAASRSGTRAAGALGPAPTIARLTPDAARPLVQSWIAPRRPGEFNQALMDLGATVCLPGIPDCPRCPLRRLCPVSQSGAGAPLLPLARAPRRLVHLGYILARRGDRVFLRQRPNTAAQLAGLWELPAAPPKPRGPLLATVRHAITTRSILAHVYAGPPTGPGRWMGPTEVQGAPLTGLARKILRVSAEGAHPGSGRATPAAAASPNSATANR